MWMLDGPLEEQQRLRNSSRVSKCNRSQSQKEESAKGYRLTRGKGRLIAVIAKCSRVGCRADQRV